MSSLNIWTYSWVWSRTCLYFLWIKYPRRRKTVHVVFKYISRRLLQKGLGAAEWPPLPPPYFPADPGYFIWRRRNRYPPPPQGLLTRIFAFGSMTTTTFCSSPLHLFYAATFLDTLQLRITRTLIKITLVLIAHDSYLHVRCSVWSWTARKIVLCYYMIYERTF